jgi:hypothetical protein
MNDMDLAESQTRSLWPNETLSRRAFVMTTLGTGVA